MKSIILKLLFLFFTTFLNVYAASYSCPGQDVANINGTTTDAFQSYTTLDESENSRYFKFSTDTNGSITITQNTQKNVSGYKNHKLSIGTICNGNDIYAGSDKTSDSTTFDVIAYKTYYVRIQEANSKNKLNVKVSFDFIKKTLHSYECSKPHAFTLRQKYILPGDLIAIGNSNICADENPKDGVCDANQLKRNDTSNIIFINSSSSSYVSTEPSSLLNTTSALLTIPPTATVKWAGLYWQGELWDLKDDVEYAKKALANKIKFKTPSGTYQDLTADEFYDFIVKHKTTNNNADPKWDEKWRYEMHYQGFKDVTTLVQNAGNGDYFVANIQATIGKLWYPGVEAAWNLQIIYEDPASNPRSISVTDGYYGLYGDGSSGDNYANEINLFYGTNCATGGANTGAYNYSVSFEVGGFLTPKESGFITDMSVFVTESDPESSSSTETLTVTKKDGTVNQVDGPNAWNYEITNKNGTNNLDRTPSYIYPIGMTIKNYQKTDLLDTEQTSTTVTFTTDSDRLILGVIGFATDLRKPNLCYDYAYSQYNHFFTEEYNPTTSPSIVGTVDTGVPIDVKLYIKNSENSDITADGIKINVLDINTTQATYHPESVQVAYPNSTVQIPVPDSSLNIDANLSNVKEINIGQMQGQEYFYTYYQIDPLQTSLNLPIHARVDYNITLPIAPDENLTIPYAVYLNSDIPLCTAGDFTYAPAKGIFNIVDSNYYNNGAYYNLPTQVTSREGNFTIISTDPDNIDTLKPVSTSVWVELIDASAFHDTNASCSEISSAISPRVLIIFDDNVSSTAFNQTTLQNAIINGTLALSNSYDFYQQARENTAFRISYDMADDNGTLLKTTTLNNGLVKLTNFPSYAGGKCNPNFGNGHETISSNCGNNGNGVGANGMTPAELAQCKECIYGLKTKLICSRDNFSIRPEALKLQLKDQNQTNSSSQVNIINDGSIKNLAAGYDYKLDINATNHQNNNSSPGYTKTFNSSTNDTAKYIWEPRAGHLISGCNDLNDSNINMTFINGLVDINTSLSEVGEYRLNVTDTTWSRVDSNSSYMTHHTGAHFANGLDCLPNVTTVQAVNSPLLNGCNISSSHTNNNIATIYNDYNVTFHPYKFDLNGTNGGNPITPTIGLLFTIVPNTTPYIYIADINNSLDENMSYHLNGSINALGKNNVTLTNFVDKCYAVPLDINISTSNRDLNDSNGNHVDYRVRFHDLNSSNNVITALDINVTDDSTTSHTDDILLQTVQTATKGYFPKNLNGTMRTRLNMNYVREKNTTINPTTLTFIKYQVNCTNAAIDCTFNADLVNNKTTKGVKDLNSTIPIRHYYGRTHAPRTTINGSDGNVSMYYEVFCNGATCNKALLQDGTDSNTTDDPRWFVNTRHTNKAGTAAQTTTIQKNAAKVTVTREANGNHPDYIGLHYDGASGYPYKATMENNASNWLIYNKYNANATTNEFEVEFIKPGGNWAGTRETNTTTDTNASKRTNRRIIW